MVYIFKLSSGTLEDDRKAEEIAAKAKSTLRGGDYEPEIVVMEGEPANNPKLFGTYSSVSYMRSILPSLENNIWHPAALE